MPAIDVDASIKQIERKLTELQRKVLPAAIKGALTDTARIARDDLRKAIPSVFDRPTLFTRRSPYAIAGHAVGSTYTATVEIKDQVSRGTPASKYLLPQVTGGPRVLKPFEARIGTHVIGGGMPVIPGRGAELDSAGNLSRPAIIRMLSDLNAFPDTGQNISEKRKLRLQKMRLATKRGGQYFIGHAGGNGRPLGIWKLVGPGKVEPVAFFGTHMPSYSPRFPYHEIVEAAVRREFDKLLWRRVIDGLRG